MAGSLGALESIGKKTMDILSEGDPGKTSALSLHCALVAVVCHRSEEEERTTGR